MIEISIVVSQVLSFEGFLGTLLYFDWQNSSVIIEQNHKHFAMFRCNLSFRRQNALRITKLSGNHLGNSIKVFKAVR